MPLSSLWPVRDFLAKCSLWYQLPESQLSRTHVKAFKDLRLNLKSNKLPRLQCYCTYTMDCNDPDLEVFESNLCLILPARESGKTSALVSNLCPNASDPQ